MTRTGAAVVITIGIVAGLIGGALPSGAIVGGKPTDVSSIPWQVSLQDSEGHFCGGSVIAANVVVTAAHCVEGLRAGDITVAAGLTNLGDPGQTRAVASVVEHPAYARTEASDIAVLLLSTPLQLSDTVQPIRLAVAADITAADVGVVSGWGATSEQDEAGTRQLLAASVPLVGDAACNSAIGADGGDGISPQVETCAGGTGTDSCYGDSGGPLTVTAADGSPALAGIVSWGTECGGSTPGVYAEVPALATFIADAISGTVDPDRAEPAGNQDDSTATPVPDTNDGSENGRDFEEYEDDPWSIPSDDWIDDEGFADNMWSEPYNDWTDDELCEAGLAA